MIVTQRSFGAFGLNCHWSLLGVKILTSPLHARGFGNDQPLLEKNTYINRICSIASNDCEYVIIHRYTRRYIATKENLSEAMPY